MPGKLAGLETRVALRTFLLFCACAMVPTIIFGMLGHRAVSSELRAQASARLADTSKRYGLLVYERLRQADMLLLELAQMHAQGQLPTERIAVFTGPLLKVLDVRSSPATGSFGAPETWQISRALSIDEQHATALVSLELRGNGNSIAIVGEVEPAYLWNAEAASLPDATICVYRGAARLHCASVSASDAVSGPQRSIPTLEAEWRLFLRPYFGADDLLIRTEQPAETALAGLTSFSAMLPPVAGIAILAAMLLSAIQIRRSHRPLAVLASAARRISRGHFDSSVAIESRDEYASLARAFNRMAANLRRQFRILSTLGHVDLMILSRTSVERVIDIMLPRVVKLLGCETAAVLLTDLDSGQMHMRLVRRDVPGTGCERVATTLGALQGLLGTRAVRRVAPETIGSCGIQALTEANVSAWHAAAINVGGRVRGVLLLGSDESRSVERASARYAPGLARRIAVALGNEDRERALLKHAYYDSLTGLPNRQLFKDRLDQELVRTRRTQEPVALLFVDLDRFKNVNDSLGHSAGDELLKIVSERLRSLIRDADTLARLGGDEFTVICPGMNGRQAGNLAKRILEALAVPISMPGMQCVAQASIGIALHPRDGATAETLLRNADTAMYRAKSTGRGRAVFFEEAMNEQATRRLRMEQRLRAALANGGLSLAFQPKVRAADGRPVGVEALARWHDPQEGPVSPAEFVSIAEETGLIASLGDWVLRSACETLAQWLRSGLDVGHVAVNVSTHQLRNSGFVNVVQQCLAAHELPPQCLELEITESALADEPEEVAAVLRQIRAQGVRIAIDDFGTGYASMAVLQQWPVDVLKIDRSFVRNCAEDERAGALAGALIGVAHALGKSVVAEGVETPAQMAFLQRHGCEILQGFLFAKPLPAAQLPDFFRERPAPALSLVR